jgi:hypothetical protein
MTCRKPFLVQIEQLHSAMRARSAVMRNRTRPQWQPPSNVLMRCTLRFPEDRYPERGPSRMPIGSPKPSSATNSVLQERQNFGDLWNAHQLLAHRDHICPSERHDW